MTRVTRVSPHASVSPKTRRRIIEGRANSTIGCIGPSRRDYIPLAGLPEQADDDGRLHRGVRREAERRDRQLAGVRVHLGFGRTVVSEREVPNLFGNMV